jgi:16S rRNA (uracil1498-N3)-methyltransferase
MGQRFFVGTPISTDRAVLSGSEAHHLLHVMRAGVGDEVILFDGSGREYTGRVSQVGRSQVELQVVASRQIDRELAVEIVVGVALPKADRQRWLMEKLVELGATRLVPLQTQRSVVHPDQKGLVKLRRTIVEATKQCGRTRLMEVSELAPFVAFLGAPPAAACRWIADPAGTVPPLPSAVAATGYVAVGPEGGWTDDELAMARSAGWQPVTLGRRVLRIETACLVLVTLLSQHEMRPTG